MTDTIAFLDFVLANVRFGRNATSIRLIIAVTLCILTGGSIWQGGTATFRPAATPNEGARPSLIGNSVSTLIQPRASQPSADLWGRIRAGVTLARSHREEVQSEIRWFLANNRLDQVADLARPYMHLVVEEIAIRGMPMDLALLPIIESSYRPRAYSRDSAAGLWQITPVTGRRFGLKQNWWYDGRRDVVASTHAALDYLQILRKRFNGDWLLALAAYNGGETRVARAIRRNRKSGKPTDFWSLKLPRETRRYVPRLLAVASIVAAPEKYQQQMKPIANERYLTAVSTFGQIDLAQAAQLADLSMDQITMYNPGFKRQVTDPNGPHTLLLPIDKAQDFATRIASLSPEQRITWRQHRIQKGDTLALIASRYDTSVSALQETNNLSGTLIRAGRDLIIPPHPTG